MSNLWDSGPQIDELFEVWWNATHVQGEGGKIVESKLVVEIKVAYALVSMVDVHVTTQSKVTKE